MYAGFLNKLKPRLPLLCQMHRLCSVARVTYSELGLTFGSKITARYAARVAELESRGHPPSRTLSHAPFCHLHPHHGHKDNTPPSPFSAWDAVPLFPQVHCPCGATIISNPPLRPAHYPIFDPLLLPGGLATSVPGQPPRVRQDTPRTPVHQTEYSLRTTLWRDPSYLNS